MPPKSDATNHIVRTVRITNQETKPVPVVIVSDPTP